MKGQCNLENSDGECLVSSWDEEEEKFQDCESMKCNGKGKIEVVESKIDDFGIIQFGKHKGSEWIRLPKSYLEYLISEECNTSELNKSKAKKVLKQKDLVKGQLQWKF